MTPQKITAVLKKAGFENARLKNTRDDKTRSGRTGFEVTSRGGVIRVGHRVEDGRVWSREVHEAALNGYWTALEQAGIAVDLIEGNRLIVRENQG